MELTKTVKVKVGKLTTKKENALEHILEKNKKAVNCTIETILEKRTTSNSKLHHLVYEKLRELNLPACVCHSARQRAVSIMRAWFKQEGKKSKPEFKADRVQYDNTYFKLLDTDNKKFRFFGSVLWKAGQKGKQSNRIYLPLVSSDYTDNYLEKIKEEEFKLGTTELVKKDSNYFLHITFSKEVDIPQPDESFQPVTIDLGINNLCSVAVPQGEVRIFSGGKVKWKWEHFKERQKDCQKRGAFQELGRIKRRTSRYVEWKLHNISNWIVERAKDLDNPVIVMENLKGIEEEKRKVRKKQRYLHNNWAYRKLQSFIEYKAQWEGIPVDYVNPAYSSQRCNKCGSLGKREKHNFSCSCGYQVNADVNSLFNLREFFFAKCKGERASITKALGCSIPEDTTPLKGSNGSESNLNSSANQKFAVSSSR